MSNERSFTPSIYTESFLKRNPTLVADFGDLFGVRLYECPYFGDERPLTAVVNCSDFIQRTWITCIWDVSDKTDAAIQTADFLKDLMNRRPDCFQ